VISGSIFRAGGNVNNCFQESIAVWLGRR
jgi:hypothetical protein